MDVVEPVPRRAYVCAHADGGFLASAGTPTMDLATYVAPETFAAFGDEWGGTSRFI